MAVPSQTVLLVEDDDSMRASLDRLLGLAGLAHHAYASAETMLADDVEAEAACVVTDLKLPGMSGLGLLAELRSCGRAVPVVLITAHDTPGLREDAMRRGAAGYLVKPFTGTVLLDAVKVAIGSARVPGDNRAPTERER